MRTTTTVLTVVIVLASWMPNIAKAQEDDKVVEEARVHFERGKELYAAGKLEEASIAFQRAYDIKPSYKILYTIAQLDNELGNYAGALAAYARYLAEGGDKIEKERLDEVKAEIKRLNALVGMIAVECDESGATVFVDKEEKGTTPLSGPIFVNLGKHEVVVRQDANVLIEQIVKVAGGEKVVVSAGGSKVEKTEPQPVEQTEPEPQAKSEEEKKGLRPLYFWIGAGSTVAFGAGTLIINVVVGNRVDKIHDAPNDEAYRNDTKSLQVGGIVMLSLTGAAAITTAVLAFLTDFSGEKESEGSKVSLGAWGSGKDGGLSIQGRF